MSNDGLTREFLAERDARIFGMRKAGVSISEISNRFGISTGAVNAAVNRQLTRLNREALMAYPEVLRLELERLDALQQAIWPLTQHRKVTAPDGSEVVVEPDLRAIQQVLSIMDRRSKLLGMETSQVSITVDATEQAPQRAVLAGADGAAAADAFDPETEVRQLLELMGSSGVLPRETVESMLGQQIDRAGEQPALSPGLDDGVIRDAEIVE
jgi:DNA-binding NarL/FixJ family response regulator